VGVDLSFNGLLIVVAAGFIAPLALGFVPSLRLPAVVLEIVLGIIIGPDVLGWVEVDPVIAVMSLLGLAFLLFLAGLEIDIERLRGRPLRLAGAGFAASLVLALAIGFALGALDLVRSPALVAVILVTTGLGVVVPVLKDAGEAGTPFGQLVIVSASIAEFGSIVLLTLLFSGKGGVGSALLLLGGFAALAAAVAAVILGAERWMRLSDVLRRLQDTTAQIRVRAAMVLMVAFVALAEGLGLEAILGAFAAGALLSVLDRDREMSHEHFREKLEAAGFGVFIPIFFVTSGVRFDLHALLNDPSTLALVPLFLGAILVARGVPALVLRPLVGARRALAAGLLQSTTSVAFLVAATQIGIDLDLISQSRAAALVAAGLVSVLVFPLAALMLLRSGADDDVTLPKPSPAIIDGP